MEQVHYLPIIGAFISLLLLIIGWFLNRLIKQQDLAHEQTGAQFKSLLEKFDTLNTTMLEHKTDVEVIKEQINTHSRELGAFNQIFDRIRIVESDVSVLKASRH